jgi:hypothetical protein
MHPFDGYSIVIREAKENDNPECGEQSFQENRESF